MPINNHEITNNGITINVNEDKGLNERFFEYTKDGVKVVITHKGEGIDDQQGAFVINAYRLNKNSNDIQIGQSENIELPVNGNTYDQFYAITENIPALQAIHRRALNGLLEMEFGNGFYAFNPVDNLNPIQPVEFFLSVGTAPTEGNSDGVISCNHTDGSGTYEYSNDGGQTWGTANAKLSGLPAGDYDISVRDKNVSNAWWRTKSITLVNA